jgi:hypothetical protein
VATEILSRPRQNLPLKSTGAISPDTSKTTTTGHNTHDRVAREPVTNGAVFGMMTSFVAGSATFPAALYKAWVVFFAITA